MITIQEFDAFIKVLTLHDWHYQYSDDHSVWSRGAEADTDIKATSIKDTHCHRAYTAWWQWVWRATLNNSSMTKTKRDEVINHIRNELT